MSQYKKLKEFSALRRKELSEMVQPFISMAEGYGSFVSDIVEILGKKAPQSNQDKIIRDLIADIFDFLYEAQELTLAGKTGVAFPLARRAFESICLLSTFMQDSQMAERWDKGKEFTNSDMRKFLSNAALGENESDLKDVYKFYSMGTHPNREVIPSRFLGEGNEYTLGVIGVPDLLLVTKHLIEISHLWFWYGACVALYHKELIYNEGNLLERYKEISSDAQEVTKQLKEEFNRLYKEYVSKDN